MTRTKPLVFLLLTLGIAAQATPADQPGDMERAQAAVAEFSKALKAELMAAMRSGGPVAAIEVCNIQAPRIAEHISAANDLQISRVSRKNRNPGNAPNDWQARVLASFEDRKQAGEDPSGLTWQETTEIDGVTEFRFMRAIPTAALCLQCHGEALAPPVAERLAELYPDDKATGFREGDLRGAFVVTRQVPD
jgi:hypothetical protein